MNPGTLELTLGAGNVSKEEGKERVGIFGGVGGGFGIEG